MFGAANKAGAISKVIPKEWVLREMSVGGQVFLVDDDTSVVYDTKGVDGWPQAIGTIQVRELLGMQSCRSLSDSFCANKGRYGGAGV